MSDHDAIAQQVDAYLHGLLSPEDASRVEQQCRTLPEWTAALEKGRRRLGLLQAMPPTEASPQLVQQTLERIDEGDRTRERFRRRYAVVTVSLLAASALLLIGLQAFYLKLKPGTLDLVLLGQRELLAATSASLRVRLVDRGSNLAISGVPVVVSLKGPDGTPVELARFTTDEQGSGSPRLDLPDWADGNYQLQVEAQTAKGPQSLTRTIKLKRACKLMLSSDKPIYQPGQKILLRSLALRRPDLRPVRGRPTVFTLTDPRGNVLFKHQQTTSDFGLAGTECELAQEIQEGTYTLACTVEGTESKLNVEVRRYVLPRFKVAVKADRPYYAPGSRVAVDLQADYFFGKPVSDGRFDFDVVTKTGQKVAEGNGKLDASGKSQLHFTLPKVLAGRENDLGDARLVITTQVTDSADQKYGAATEAIVTAHPVRIHAIPESGRLVADVPNRVFLLVTRADGSPLPGVQVQVASDSLDLSVKTDARGVASFEVNPVGSDVRWLLTVLDNGGKPLARREDRHSVGTSITDYLVRPDRAVYQAGQTLTLNALGGGSEPVFVDLLKDEQTMLSQTITMANGRGELVLDLPADLFGTLQLVTYRFDPQSGLPIRKSRVLYVAPPDTLRVRATLDREEYRPGKQAKLSLRLEDTQGRPTPGAISLVGVDEAVYSVLTQKLGLERTFYTLEQELLQPVYALYPWQPEADASDRDRALFAATSRGIDPLPVSTTQPARFPQIPETGPHTLAVRSLPIEQQRVEDLQNQRFSQLKRSWMILGLLTALAFYIGLWMWIPLEDFLKMHAIGFVALLFIGGLGFIFLGFLGGRVDSRFSMVGARVDKAMAPAAAEIRFRDPTKSQPEWDSTSGSSTTEKAPLPRVRKHFPETLLWKPELITDEQGRLPPLDVQLADSITTWRLSASAVAADGRLGATQFPLRVFQPFFVDLNLPVSLTRGDEIGIPVVVYNYLDRPQTVSLSLTQASWFKLDGPAIQKIDLGPGEVRSTRFTIQVGQVGLHTLKVTALAGSVGDAIERSIEVEPDGKRIEVAYSGGLARPVTHALHVPPQAIPGSVKAFVKIYPSSFSQLVEGLENIFRMPSGCFEQTSSTTYPNVLALDYLRRNHLNLPAVEARARQYIHLGYQRLVSFEVTGGGFDWYGRPPANLVLTAYGLMEFTDMARVHDVDPRLLTRTRTWLLQQRRNDGSWLSDLRGTHMTGASDSTDAALATTAYVAWAVFGGDSQLPEAQRTLDWLLRHRPADLKNPHTLALLCNAIVAIDSHHKALPAYLDRLVELSNESADGQFRHWDQNRGTRTLFYASGPSGQVETTALAILALQGARQHPTIVRSALAWLVARKDPHGTWHSTQATVLALKALLAGTGSGESRERRLELTLGTHRQEVILPADQAEVMKMIDLSQHLAPGDNSLTLAEKSDTGAGYQVVFRHHIPESQYPEKPEPLAISLNYDRTELNVGGAVKVQAKIVNQQDGPAPMVMLDLPIPPGFAPEAQEFAAMVTQGQIARFQVLPRSILVYLRSLDPAAPLELEYTLRATMPLRVANPGARVYEYYDPQKSGASRPTRFVVRP